MQKEIDTEAGDMNYEAVQGLRRIEGCAKGQEGVFVSRSTLRRTAKKLEEHAFDKGMGFTTEETPRGTIYNTDGNLRTCLGISFKDLEHLKSLIMIRLARWTPS